MRPSALFHHLGIIELHIKELVNTFQRAANPHLVLELHVDRVIDKGLEETNLRNSSLVRQSSWRNGSGE